MIGLLPVTGVPLPFVSFGGSSLVIVMAATGLLLSVARERPAPSGAGRQRHSSGYAGGRGDQDGVARADPVSAMQ